MVCQRQNGYVCSSAARVQRRTANTGMTTLPHQGSVFWAAEPQKTSTQPPGRPPQQEAETSRTGHKREKLICSD